MAKRRKSRGRKSRYMSRKTPMRSRVGRRK